MTYSFSEGTRLSRALGKFPGLHHRAGAGWRRTPATAQAVAEWPTPDGPGPTSALSGLRKLPPPLHEELQSGGGSSHRAHVPRTSLWSGLPR